MFFFLFLANFFNIHLFVQREMDIAVCNNEKKADHVYLVLYSRDTYKYMVDTTAIATAFNIARLNYSYILFAFLISYSMFSFLLPITQFWYTHCYFIFYFFSFLSAKEYFRWICVFSTQHTMIRALSFHLQISDFIHYIVCPDFIYSYSTNTVLFTLENQREDLSPMGNKYFLVIIWRRPFHAEFV